MGRASYSWSRHLAGGNYGGLRGKRNVAISLLPEIVHGFSSLIFNKDVQKKARCRRKFAQLDKHCKKDKRGVEVMYVRKAYDVKLSRWAATD